MNVTDHINVTSRIIVKSDIIRVRVRKQFSCLRRSSHLPTTNLKNAQPSVARLNIVRQIPRLRPRMVYLNVINKISSVEPRFKPSESCEP